MDINLIKIGSHPPIDVNVIIEIPIYSNIIKYEIDKKSGIICVDRFLKTPMYYPGNYGFIPHTLSKDGDPIDVIICNKHPLITGCIINTRPIGTIIMEDEKGEDEKIIAVPTEKITQYYNNINNYTDLPDIFLKKVEYFFSHYKDLDENKWTKIKRWANKDLAYKLIKKSIERAKVKNL